MGGHEERRKWNLLRIVRARLYHERGLVFKEKGDRPSFQTCLRSSITLHPCRKTCRELLGLLQTEVEIESVKKSIEAKEDDDDDENMTNVDDLAINYLLYDSLSKPVL